MYPTVTGWSNGSPVRPSNSTALPFSGRPASFRHWRIVSSLAQVHLRTGEPKLAEEQARHALELLGDRVDVLDEIGNAQLVLGRSLLEQDHLDEADELFKAAEASFEQGDLAVRRGEDRHAAHLYRRAAEALQDFRF